MITIKKAEKYCLFHAMLTFLKDYKITCISFTVEEVQYIKHCTLKLKIDTLFQLSYL